MTAIQCHHYLDRPGRRAALERCHALLRPGGLLVAFENVRQPSEDATRISLRHWEAYQRDQGKTAEAARAHIARFGTEFFPITAMEHLAVLEEVGFRTTGLLWQTYLQSGLFRDPLRRAPGRLGAGARGERRGGHT